MLKSEQIALLDRLPKEWRYTLTGGNANVKVPISSGWNNPGNGLSKEAIELMADGNASAYSWMITAASGIGTITGPESGRLLVIDFDGVGDQAERVFAGHFQRPCSELPQSLTSISGKEGRRKVFFRVNEDQALELGHRSAVWKDEEGGTVLEAIWVNTTGKSRQAVISGTHPSSTEEKPLFYRWLDINAQWADAPEWLVEGVLRKMDDEKNVIDASRSGENDGEPTAYEQLHKIKQWELCADALDHCPTREAKGSGTYPLVRRVVCALMNEWGRTLAEIMIAQSKWEKMNNWDVNESTYKLMASLAQSEIPADKKVGIGSLFHLAQRHSAWVWPDEYKPPKPASAIELQEVSKFIEQMNFHYQNPTMTAIIRGKLSKFYGLRDTEIMRLRLEAALGKVVKNKTRADDLFQGLFARRVHLLAGASHSGKTSLAAFIAGKVINPEYPTAEEFGLGEYVETPSGPMNVIDVGNVRHASKSPGKVLIFTSDCSDEDMIRDLTIEGATRTAMDERLKVVSGLSFNDMLEIVLTIQQFEPDLVIMDCLTSMAIPGVSQSDPAYASPIRELVRYNGVKWKKAAFFVLHHTLKYDPRKSAGTEQIKAAAEELLLYYDPHAAKHSGKPGRPPKNPNPNLRHLEFEKSRGGYRGKTIFVERDGMNGRWDWRPYSPTIGEVSPYEYLVNSFLNRTDETWRTPSEWRRILQAEQVSKRMMCRYLQQLEGKLLDKTNMKDQRNRPTTHYRVKEEVRKAAMAMLSSNGLGQNYV